MSLKDDLMFKNPGGYFWKFLVGVYRPVLQILTLFQTKNVIFHTRFQTRPLKSIPVFRPGLWAEIMLSLLRLERKQKILQSHFQFNISLSFLLRFGIETINTSIHSRGSIKNHTLFQTKLGKIYTRFHSGKLRHGSPMIQSKSDGGWSISEHLSSKRMRLCQIHTCVVSVN